MSYQDESDSSAEWPIPTGADMPDELPTDPIGSPGLDLVILSNARRALVDAERHTAAGMHASALADAREALRKVALALAIHDRTTLVERLVSDTEPKLSAERDLRPEAT